MKARCPGRAAHRLRLREPGRLSQVHLDWLMMAVLPLAPAAALPGWVAVLVVAGAIVKPLHFLPLAVHGSQVRETLAYRVVAGASFTAMSVGLVASGVTALT